MQYKKVVATIPGVNHPDGRPHQDNFFVLNDFSLVEGEMKFNNPPAMSSGGELFYLTGDIENPTAHRDLGEWTPESRALVAAVKKERRRIEEKLRKDKAFLFSLLPAYVRV